MLALPVWCSLALMLLVGLTLWAWLRWSSETPGGDLDTSCRRRDEVAQRARFAALRRRLSATGPPLERYTILWREILDNLTGCCDAYADTALALARYLTRHPTPVGQPVRVAVPPALARFDEELRAVFDNFWRTYLNRSWHARLQPLTTAWTPAADDDPAGSKLEVLAAGWLHLPADVISRLTATVAKRLAEGELPGGDSWAEREPLERLEPLDAAEPEER